MTILFEHNRTRFAISVNPVGEMHIGHLYGLVYSHAYAKKNKTKFHIRFDDSYVKFASTFNDYPKKDPRWEADSTAHLPGKGLYEITRPKSLTDEFMRKTVEQIMRTGLDVDDVYRLSDKKDAIDKLFGNSFYSHMPLFLVEDAFWNHSHILRGDEWNIDSGEYREMSKMQILILNSLNSNYTVTNFKNIKIDGEKISKSNSYHSCYNIKDMSDMELQTIIDTYSKDIDKEIHNVI